MVLTDVWCHMGSHRLLRQTNAVLMLSPRYKHFQYAWKLRDLDLPFSGECFSLLSDACVSSGTLLADRRSIPMTHSLGIYTDCTLLGRGLCLVLIPWAGSWSSWRFQAYSNLNIQVLWPPACWKSAPWDTPMSFIATFSSARFKRLSTSL